MSDALKRRLRILGLIMTTVGSVALFNGPAQSADIPQHGNSKAPPPKPAVHLSPAPGHLAPPAHLSPAPGHVAPPAAHLSPPPGHVAPPAATLGPKPGGNVIGNGSAGLISPGNRNGVVSQGGGNVVSQGGGNVVGNSSASMTGGNR